MTAEKLRRRTLPALVLAALVPLLLAGCGTYIASPTAAPDPPSTQATTTPPPVTPTTTPTSTPTTAPARTASPTATPSPKAKPKPKPAAPAKPVLQPGPAIWERGDSGRDVRELQARLAQIRWFNAGVTGNYGPVTEQAVAGFQKKRGFPVTGEVDKRTWNRLVAMTREPTRDELNNVKPKSSGSSGSSASRLDARCQTGRVVCISKGSRTLYWVVDGEVRSTLAVRFGSQFTPTREGTFSVYLKSRDHVSKLYDSAMPFSLFFSGGQAVHYSADFAARGYYGASHGCVNTRDYGGMRGLYNSVRVGDRVVVY